MLNTIEKTIMIRKSVIRATKGSRPSELRNKSLGLPKNNRHYTLIKLSNISKLQYSRIPQYSLYYIKMG